MADLRGYVEGLIGFEGDGTNVVANPTGTPTDDLESIQIGDVIYNIGGGGEEIVPTPTNTDRGKYLGVKSGANELEYREVREVPNTEGASAGTVLTHTISGESWLPPAKELPTYTEGDNGKVLGVSSGALAWLTQGGGSGYEFDTLFTQDVGSVGNIALSDSITNYDFILFVTNQQGVYCSFHMYPVDLFKAWCSAMSAGIMCWEFQSRYMTIGYVNDSTLKVADISGTILSAIYGIKV